MQLVIFFLLSKNERSVLQILLSAIFFSFFFCHVADGCFGMAVFSTALAEGAASIIC